ncbi:serine--tRNA ligase [Patescibacteria group bacterium]|nr:serine--tRNA ligase [Patescibacteria group bacterium]HOM77903.1 serine--tRNA ligase [bacterium]
MLDPEFVRKNPELIRQNIINRGITDLDFDAFLEVDSQARDALRLLETKRALRNSLSEAISKVSAEERQKLIEEASQIKVDIQKLEEEYSQLAKQVQETLVRIPNMSSPEMPVGQGEEDNEVLKVWLPTVGYLEGPFSYSNPDYMPEIDFPHKDHVTLGEELDLIDVKQSALVSGSRFCYLKNEAVLLQDAIFAMLKLELQKRGFIPLVPPLLVKERSLFGTSHFPEGREYVYKIENFNVEENNDLYLVGSSEPSNFSYFMDKILDIKDLPIKVYAQTTCFRSEVGSWGKDVRGIKRVHQFDKLEMNAVCLPEKSREIFEEFSEINEWMLQQLRLPYRIINKCTADAGYNASYLQHDFDYWRPGEREFMEGGTNTMTTDYQARRLNIRYKAEKGTEFVHTVNDTACAVGRAIIAILENYQQPDGTVRIPEVLRPFMNGKEKILRKATS